MKMVSQKQVKVTVTTKLYELDVTPTAANQDSGCICISKKALSKFTAHDKLQLIVRNLDGSVKYQGIYDARHLRRNLGYNFENSTYRLLRYKSG